MALLTFPLALTEFYDLLPIGGCRMDMRESIDVGETEGGEVLTADIGTALWTGQIDMQTLEHHEAAAVRPVINVLRRAGTSFLVADATRPWPRLDPHGTLLGAATPTILAVGSSMREISIEGLPAGYQISRGDLISWTYGSSPTRYALHECIGSATADGAGETALIEVTPPIRPGTVAGAAVALLWPHCKARLVPGSADTGKSSHTITSEMTFRWTQTLGA